jgi:hypothetical protein
MALAGERVSSAPRVGAQTTLRNNLILVTEWRPVEAVRVRPGGALHESSQGYVSLTAYPGTAIPLITFSAIVGDAVDYASDRLGHGETVSASLLWRPVNRLEIQPSLDLTRVRTAADSSGDALDSRESVAQLLATVHLTARDRFRLIVQRIDVERETPLARLVDESQLLGSLLFTHERSLTRRVYAGVSFARGESQGEPARETLEVFVKLQWGFSSTRGFRM